MNVPKLRFKEFNDEYNLYKMSDISKINQGLQIEIKERFTEKGPNRYFYITNQFLKNDSKEIYYIENPSESVICNEDDILMTRTGNTGKVLTNISGCFHNNFFKIKYDKSIVNKNYLYYILTSPKIQKTILNYAGTSTIPDLNHSDFYRIKVFFPSIKEQEKISKTLELLDKKIELQSKKIEDLKLFKLCIMKSIFDSSKASINLKIKDISLIEKGKQINGDQLLEFGDYYMLNGGINPSGYLNVYNRNENTITISEGGNSCGYVSFNKNKFWCGGHCYSISPININNEYLYQLLKYNERKIMDLRVGSGLPNIQKKDLENLSIKIHNNSDQQNISILLSKYDSKLDLEIIKLNILTKLKKGLMQSIFV